MTLSDSITAYPDTLSLFGGVRTDASQHASNASRSVEYMSLQLFTRFAGPRAMPTRYQTRRSPAATPPSPLAKLSITPG